MSFETNPVEARSRAPAASEVKETWGELKARKVKDMSEGLASLKGKMRGKYERFQPSKLTKGLVYGGLAILALAVATFVIHKTMGLEKFAGDVKSLAIKGFDWAQKNITLHNIGALANAIKNNPIALATVSAVTGLGIGLGSGFLVAKQYNDRKIRKMIQTALASDEPQQVEATASKPKVRRNSFSG